MKKSVLILVALLVVSLYSCTQPVEKEIGIQLYSVRDDMRADPEATVAKIGEIGYSFVEAAGYGDGQFYGMDPLAFKTLVNNNGMEFLASHTGQALPDSTNWNEVMEWWDVCIDAHAKTGV